ncbi:MAG: hypothetical protein M1434_01965 [Chloroflexi bacterium]|nr:hypothetical protein [Chloroflexota bacterium]MCL5273495.1 hypothetical protein [Chloroflexota bacterium]
MDTIRKPLFVAAVVLILVVFLLEIGSSLFINRFVTTLSGGAQSVASLLPNDPAIQKAFNDPGMQQQEADLASQGKPPGLGILYLALLDGVLLFTILLTGSGLVIRQDVQANVQGCLSLVVSLLAVIAGIVAIISAIILVILMVALLLAVPFGTIAYLILYGFFNRDAASVVLSLLMALKIAFAVVLILSQQRFLERKGLLLLIGCSLLGNVVISILQGFPPGFLVSITDGIAAILVGLCGAIWWVILLIGAIPAILKVLGLVKLAER